MTGSAFTDEDLDTTSRVLDWCLQVESGDSSLRGEEGRPRLRPIFKSLRAIARAMTQKRLDGLDLDEYIRQKCSARLGRLRATARLEEERQRGRCGLRAGREATRQRLLAQLRGSAEPVPDGPVQTSAALDGPSAEEGCVCLHSRPCYVCKARFSTLHHFYDQLCPTCAGLNWQKRHQTADLSGKTALVTGGRVKIGFIVARKLLDAGAAVIVTTRFPLDAAERFAKESGFAEWGARLSIRQLDLRDIGRAEAFCAELCRELDSLDILVNNAAQTIRRDPAFYAQLTDLRPPTIMEAQVRHLEAARPVDKGQGDVNIVDGNGQPLDLRATNSWRLRLGDVGTLELAEVMAINAVAPAVLAARLKPLLARKKPIAPANVSFVVNVSAMEGRFSRWKSHFHPHTNMAKAALNMLTRTSGQDYAEGGIFMTAVDTGWINEENPAHIATAKFTKSGFTTPLDEIDGAARILDPILSYVNGQIEKPSFGIFLKDYAQCDW